MNPVVGWGLAALGVALAWMQYGVQGVGLAASAIVFWLLLQFGRALRVMKLAAGRPVGRVDSAVMLNARLRAGMSLMQVLPHTRSLGERVGAGDDPERWRWTDAGGASVTLELRRGRLAAWSLQRPGEAQAGIGIATGTGEATDGAGHAGADRSR